MKKKLIRIMIALALSFITLLTIKKITAPKTIKGDKIVEIVVLDLDRKTIFDQSFETNSELLGELLDEINQDEYLEFTFSDSGYGRMIMGINNLISDPIVGPWWIINSNTNPDAINQGYCNGIDTQTIYNNDVFELSFENFE